jgi:hypothetical protein
MTHSGRAARAATFSRHSGLEGVAHPGPKYSRSRWMSGSPSFSARRRARVLLPAPGLPMTRMRLMDRNSWIDNPSGELSEPRGLQLGEILARMVRRARQRR